jgi:hypothetical protein
MTRSKSPTPVTADNPAISGPRAPADRLYRAASECVRQRERYAALVESAVTDAEQFAALEIAGICDKILLESIGMFEAVGASMPSKDEEWYKKAVLLWQASREYQRRHTQTDLNSRRWGSHTAEQLKQLTMEYDLEASALLALQHALSAYRKVVPEAHIEAMSSRLN